MTSSATLRPHSAWIGVILAITATSLFALKSIFIKLAYQYGVSADVLLLLRLMLALPFYVGMLVYLISSQQMPSSLNASLILKVLLLGFLGYYLASYLNLWGLEYISAQLERLTLFTYPAIIALLSWLLLGEKITQRIILALALCYVGILLMYFKEAQWSNSTHTQLGIGLVLGAAVSFACYVVLSKPTMQKIGSRAFTSIAMIGSTGFMLVHALLLQDHLLQTLQQLPLSVWGYAALLAFVSTVIPSFLMSEAIVRIGATRTTIIGTIGPVVTFLLAIVILQEPTSAWHLAGMVVVLIGVSLVSRP